jgi:DNA-binding MarR family transcriptional regulator
MGLSRQSVQRIVNELSADGLFHLRQNPHHKRAALVCLTDEGKTKFDAITALQIPWANSLAVKLKGQDIEAAQELITKLSRLLESRVGEP